MTAVPGTARRAAAGRLASLLCFVLPAAWVTSYTLDHFYTTGAYVWDSGLFAHFSAFTDRWPMLWPDFLHRKPEEPRLTFFSIHFMPIFYPLSALHSLVAFVPPAAWFAVLQGLWSGILGLAVFMLCARPAGTALAVATALATAFCGPMLATIGYPHVETAIPALLVLFFGLRDRGRPIAAWLALALCLSIREDAGLHSASFLILLVLAQGLSRAPRQAMRGNLVAIAVCLACSILALALQHVVYPGQTSSLKRVFLGDPIGAHITWHLVAERVQRVLTDWGYAVWPAVIVLVVALWRRNLVLLAGALAPMPWVALALLAVRDIGLADYYAFPLIVTIAWPTIAQPHDVFAVRLQLLVAIVSILLFVALSGPIADRAPWRTSFFADWSAVGRYETVLRDAVSRRGELGRLMLDDGVISLVPEAAGLDEWTRQWEVDRLPNPDVVIYMHGGRVWGETEKVIAASGLTHTCRIAGTPFMVASRAGTSLCPSLGR